MSIIWGKVDLSKGILAYGNCARGTSGSQNCGVLSVKCMMHCMGSRFQLRFRMLQLKTPFFAVCKQKQEFIATDE